MTKTEIVTALSVATGLRKQQVAGFFREFVTLIGKSLSQEGAGTFTIPDLLTIKVVRKLATGERQGINPFTKEKMIIKAKPARTMIKLVPLKGLKVLLGEEKSAPAPFPGKEVPLSADKESQVRVAEDQSREILNVETENLKRWQESGQARAWVEARQGRWDHQQWLSLLEELQHSSFWPMRPAEVGMVLEEARRAHAESQ
jgi:nucleoid DNA-binding protein